MPGFKNDGLTLHYVERGDGVPVVLLHGFGMSAQSCWIETGLVDLLASNGFRVIALDARGHGGSDKPTDPAQYESGRMTGDILACLKHVGVERCAFVGHSMGGRSVLTILAQHGACATTAVVIGNGSNVFQPMQAGMMADALQRGDTSGLPAPVADFVEMVLAQGNDPSALAAYCRVPRPALGYAEVAAISAPVQLICGEADPVAIEPEKLRDAIPHANLLIVREYEHTDVLGSQMLQEAVVAWLKATWPSDPIDQNTASES